MPYVITKRWDVRCEYCDGDGEGDHGPCPDCDGDERIVLTTRQAVETLEQAREALSSAIGDVYSRTGDALDAVWCGFLDAPLPGTVGPLPDGTVITVEPFTEVELAAFTDMSYDDVLSWPAARIVAAFNAAQE